MTTSTPIAIPIRLSGTKAEEPIPSAAVAPESVEQVQQIVRIAGAHKIPLWTISTGKNLGYGGSAPLLGR